MLNINKLTLLLLSLAITPADAIDSTVGLGGSAANCTTGTLAKAIKIAERAPGPNSIWVSRNTALGYELTSSALQISNRDLEIVGGFDNCWDEAPDAQGTDVSGNGGARDRQNVFVQFAAAPAAQVYADMLSTRTYADLSTVERVAAASNAQAQHVAIQSEQSAFLNRLSASGIEYDLLYHASRSINGVALRVAPEAIGELRTLLNVVRVEVIQADELHHASSVPYIGAPRVWDNTVGLSGGATGRGISIGIIDTGIDYQHASFGGTGALADYQANDRTIITDAHPAARFPTTKIVGGFDFVGDAYHAGSFNLGDRVPAPDPDPMDCNGHGSHVAGTAAGFGVNTETSPAAPPTPYTGPWNSTTNYATLKVAPGVAPQAELYALRIFGCGGTTVMTVAAIEWAMDPNGDGNMSDRLDVINLSLGSRFGHRFHPTAIAADAAAAIGIVVVAAAGNDGDTPFIAAAPGSAARALSVANIQHEPSNSGVNWFSSRGPVSSAPIILVKPDVAAPGTNIRSVQTGITCTGTLAPTGCIVANPSGFIPNSNALQLSGTSMATPHLAGVAALLRELYPMRSVEEVKAMIVNRASRDVMRPGGSGVRYPASRVGAGQVDAARAATASVVLYNDEDPGAVSIAFESAVRGSVTRVKRARLVNHSALSRTFELSLDTVTDAPGVTVSLPDGPIVTVPANSATTIAVQLTGNANQMDHARDPSMDASINIANVEYPLGYVSEESVLLKLSAGGVEVLRLPVYALVYPESVMSTPAEIATGGAASGTTTINLSGQGVCTGTLAGPSCAIMPPQDQVSLVSAFELQAVSPRNRSLDPAADLRHVGIAYTSDDGLFHFAISTYGPWASPSESSFSVEIDCGVYALGANFAADTCTGAPDGNFDMRLYSTNLGILFRFFLPLDSYVSSVVGLHSGRDRPDLLWGPSALPPFNYVNGNSAFAGNSRRHHNEVQFISAPRSLLKINRRFNYRVSSCPGFNPLCVARLENPVGFLTWDRGVQGLRFDGGLRAQDLHTAPLAVTWNSTNLAANASLGGLLLHHHNGAGDRAEVVVLEGAASGDIGVALSVSNLAPAVNSTVMYRISVTNNDADPASAIATVLELPPGMSFVSANGAGTFTSTTGTWSIASLAAGATATIDVIGRVTMSGPQEARAVLSTVAPIDVVPSNDQAAVTIHGSSSTQLILFRDSFE